MAALEERYANVIKGKLFGHNHEDFVEILHSFADGSPVAIGFSNPSLGT